MHLHFLRIAGSGNALLSRWPIIASSAHHLTPKEEDQKGLLADKEQTTCQSYHVLQDKEVDGVMRKSVVRSTFVIDKNGIIRHALYGVSSRGHAEEVLQLVKELN